ncbi:MAG: hypothetical protein IPM32_08785 [Ignavibacteriae bacterium]|nr:hypothetical protein [Ignavibacteriota bacterium]MBK8943678.1 hypothetical protein [Ignavibacteriota bacterium]MBK8945350.1 hypothetical protein [Ignavibacteriota bacterium]
MKNTSMNIIPTIAEIQKAANKNLILKFSTFAKLKNINRNMVYQLRDSNSIDTIKIDKVEFVIMNDKAKKYQKSK